MKWYKKLLVWLSLLLFSLCPILSNINCYASTTSGNENLFEYTENYVRDNFNALCRFVVKQNAIISDAIIGTWDNFVNWLDSTGNGDIWEQHPHSPIRGNDIEVPEEVLNVLNQYVIYQIQQNPQTYVQCYIPSYNMLNSDYFYTYQSFVAVKDFIRNSGGYCYLGHDGVNNSNRKFYIITLPSNIDYGLYGTVTSGIFTNVNGIYNWQSTTQPFNLGLGLKFYTCTANGTITETSVAQGNVRSLSNISNVPSTMATSQNWVIMSPLSRNELVYVFSSVNAYKSFNSGSPQPYYLTSDGQNTNMSNWSVGSGSINTGTLSSANSSYSSVINNVQTGWTAQEVLELVNLISENGGDSNGGGSSSDNPFGFLGTIGEIIGQLVSGVGELLTGIVDGIANVFLGKPNEQGVRSGGLFSVVKSVITGLVDLIDTDFAEFFRVVFDWLPPEIITLMISGLTFALFFGILKMIRG